MYNHVLRAQSHHRKPARKEDRRTAVSMLFIVAITIISTLTAAAQATKSTTGELPRFVSLKANPVNLRTGPGRQYPKTWIFHRAGLPVEIIQTYGTWRRVRDSEGANGWVSQYLLSRRRTVLVLPWEKKKSDKPIYIDLKSLARTNSKTVARLEAGTLASVKSCDGMWCYVSIDQFSGYIAQKVLWGVYPSEKIN